MARPVPSFTAGHRFRRDAARLRAIPRSASEAASPCDMVRRALHFVRGTHARAIAAAERVADEQLSRLSTARFGRARTQFGAGPWRAGWNSRGHRPFPFNGYGNCSPAIALALVGS